MAVCEGLPSFLFPSGDFTERLGLRVGHRTGADEDQHHQRTPNIRPCSQYWLSRHHQTDHSNGSGLDELTPLCSRCQGQYGMSKLAW